MAHFAEVENDVVVRVLVIDDSIVDGQTFLSNTLGLGGQWIQTSYNTFGNVHKLGGIPLHKNYAGFGYTWDGIGFAAPKPFNSWTLDENSYLWQAPISMPIDGKIYVWDETALSWVEIELPSTTII